VGGGVRPSNLTGPLTYYPKDGGGEVTGSQARCRVSQLASCWPGLVAYYPKHRGGEVAGGLKG
jgi:hypothetical protein